ncbi:MAG: CHAT domain-containing protein, partial [Rubrivivax sp.]
GLSLPASAAMLDGLLKAAVKRDDQLIGGVDAVHFAGHGDFDPSRPDGAALFLEDGTPLRSTAFRAARYGGECQPLLFLNACMLGIGGELLGDMGGFPGNSLRGGFGGVLGALWEVDDQVAHDVALEFWRRALPPAPARGEPIGAILRDLRTRYAPEAKPAPVATYLAYVYYGHPRLTLQRQPL